MASSAALTKWLSEHNFVENPFALREAGREKRLSEYFVEGPHYEEIKGDDDNPQNTLVFAARGCGKSAYRVMIQQSCRPIDRRSSILAIPYTRFEHVLAAVNRDLDRITPEHHLQAIIAAGLTALLHEFVESPQSFLGLSRRRQGTFTALMSEHIPSLLHPIFLCDCLQRWGKQEAADLFEETFDSESPDRAADPDPLQRFLHSLTTVSPTPLPGDMSPAKCWQAMVTLSRRIGLKAAYVLVDGLDEFPETAADRQSVIPSFLLPLVGSLSSMEGALVAFKLFLPLESREVLRDHPVIHLGRLKPYSIEWRADDLVKMLRERLKAFSKGRVESLKAIAGEDVPSRVDEQLADWAYGSPRKALTLGDLLFAIHCEREGEGNLMLTVDDLEQVPERFRREYGPLLPPLSVDEKQRKVFTGGRPIREKLSSLEYRLLSFLYQNAGEVKSKDDLYLAVYETTEGISNEAIDSLVFRLRQRIEPYPKPVYLITQRGQGYYLANTE